MRNHQLESRVRENRTHGSEGGESVVLFPTPIRKINELDTGFRRCDEELSVSLDGRRR